MHNILSQLLRACMLVLFIAICVNIPCHAQGLQVTTTPAPVPLNLVTALSALPPGAFERASVLLIVQNQAFYMPEAPDTDTPTDTVSAAAAAQTALAGDLTTPEGIAAAYHRLYTSFGRVLVMASPTMTVLNTDPEVANIPLAEIAGQRPLPFLLGLLTDSQWQTLALRGLGMADLTPDEQSLLQAALPDPFQIVPKSAKEPSLSKEDNDALRNGTQPERDVAMAHLEEANKLYAGLTQTLATKDVLSSVRLRAFLATECTLNNPTGQDIGLDPDSGSPATTGTSKLLHDGRTWDMNSAYAKRLAKHLRTDVPNELKQGDLSWTRPELMRPISLTGAKDVTMLVNRIAKVTGLELHVDARYGSDSLLLLGDTSHPQPARDILQALCIGVAGTWRALGPAYVLTDDMQGLGTRTAILQETVQSWANRLTEADREIGGHLRDLHWATSLSFGSDDPATLTPAQLAELSRQDHGIGYTGSLPWSDLPPAMQSALRAQLVRTDYDDSFQAMTSAIALLIKPTYKVGFNLNLRLALEMPGTGAMTLGDIYRVQSPDRPKLATKPPKPPSQTITFTEPLRGVLCAPTTPTEAALAVDRLSDMGMNTLFCDVFHNGATYFTNTVLPPLGLDAGNVLTAALAEGKAKHVAVYAVLDTFCWQKNSMSPHPTLWPAGYSPDLTICGELPDAAIQRRLTSKSLRDDFEAEWILPQQGSQEWASPQDPKVQAMLPALVRSVAQTSGLAGLVFEDTAPPGYLSVDDRSDMDIDLGYTPAARLAFLRAHQIDPVDIATEYELMLFLPYSGFSTQFDVRLPGFESSDDMGWLAQRGDADKAIMTKCYAAAHLASPTLPLLMRERRIGATLDPWTDPHKLNQYVSTISSDNPYQQTGAQSVLCVEYGPFERSMTNGLARSAKRYREDIGGKRAKGILFGLVNDGNDGPLSVMLDEIAPYFPVTPAATVPAVQPVVQTR